MTRDEVQRQVMIRVRVPVGMDGHAAESLERWLQAFPVSFVFSPSYVQAGCRLLRRELGLA